MHEFHYKGNDYYCEDTPLVKVADHCDTPAYVYSYKTLTSHYLRLDQALSEVDHMICYSLKSNSNLAVCRSLVQLGAGVDIVSGGELYRALSVGTAPKKIVFAGVGKTVAEIELALLANILFFTVESFAELEQIQQVSQRMGKVARVAIRINPDVDPHTHAYTTTGKAETKFGMDMASAMEAYKMALAYGNLDPVAVHMHIGSQIIGTQPFCEAINKIIPFVNDVRNLGVQLQYLDIGGGLGIIYKDETPSTPREFASAVLPALKQVGLKIILEPGRFIAGNAGVLLTRVLYVKKTPEKCFIIVDAGMNDLLRPSLYNAFHQVVPVHRREEAQLVCDVVGPVCESGDFFAKDRSMPAVRAGDILAICSAGAYGFTMASNYNSRPRPVEVLVKDESFYIVRERERVEDLTKSELIPKFLQ
ncbi:MAG: diaminopimelate decarboxylase [Chlamydiota bacterium]|nr:diaminopimelate decarboxylase [Chlamydiota bacterium]